METDNRNEFRSVKEMIKHQLDTFETERLLGQLPIKDESQRVSYEQVTVSIQQLLDQDLDDCIGRGFEKLDIRDENRVSINALRTALFYTTPLYNCKQLDGNGKDFKKEKDRQQRFRRFLKQMYKYLNESFAINAFDSDNFKNFILSVLQPERVKKQQTQAEKIASNHCRHADTFDLQTTQLLFDAQELDLVHAMTF